MAAAAAAAAAYVIGCGANGNGARGAEVGARHQLVARKRPAGLVVGRS
jgi:hypothetical protein